MGGRTTWLLPALLLLLYPGSAAITSPKAARGLERGSLTVQCQYGPGYKNYVKWWCRGADWGRCKFFVKTTGSEQEVKKDRVSIKDNQKNRSFTVTMEKLRLNDADTYWCGIERIGTDLGVQIEVTVDPGKSMCMCGCVSSGPALSWSLGSILGDLTVMQRELSQGVGES
nr:CMRF35-like molecule 5 [Camelus dromedarius]